MEEEYIDDEPPPWGSGSICTLTDDGTETVAEKKARLLAAKQRMSYIGFYPNALHEKRKA